MKIYQLIITIGSGCRLLRLARLGAGSSQLEGFIPQSSFLLQKKRRKAIPALL